MATPDGGRMPLIEHLRELRRRVVKSSIAIMVGFVFGWILYNPIITKLAEPVCDLKKAQETGATHCGSLYINGVLGPLNLQIKVALLTGVILMAPVWLYQLWAFIAPGLYVHERKLILPLVVSSYSLFIIGMAFAYFLVFPVLFGFVTSSAPQGVAVMTDIGSYLDFVTTMFVSFGIAFEVPIAVLLLVRFNLVKIESLKEARSYVIVGAFVIGAILTPPDVISQVMLAVPLWILYEAGVFVAGFVAKPQTVA